MIDNELAFALPRSSSTELLPTSGDDSVFPLESGVLDNSSTSALSDPFSQDVTELSKTYEKSDSSLTDESQQLTNTTVAEADPLTGNTSVGAATPESIYEFDSVTVDGITLNYIKTVPSNIELLENDGTVPEASNLDAPAAINGGYFNDDLDLLSIAVNDGEALDGINGEANNFSQIERGTLYWDGETNTTGVQPVRTIEELEDLEINGEPVISDPNNYWAQGGISMGLKLLEATSPYTGENEGLSQQTYDEDLDGVNGQDTAQRPRTALIHDNLSNNGTGETGSEVYLITTQNPIQDVVTFGEFRAAIRKAFTDTEGPAEVDDVNAEGGIFLDSGGSTQIKTPEFEDDGDGRAIPQIVALKSTR